MSDDTPTPTDDGSLRITATITIPKSEYTETFIRSAGPGGQNVNKVASAVQLRFHVASAASLTPAIKTRLRRRAGRRLTDTDEIVITANRHRSQARNRADARNRLIGLVQAAVMPPKPRIATKPSAAAKRRRLETKRRRSALKASRRAKPDLD